jgi:excisionase family DNA binding protein
MTKKRQQHFATSNPKTAKEATTNDKTGHIEIWIDGARIELSPELEAAVERAQQGKLRSQPNELTTTQAAAYLDVSRPFVIKLVKQGMLPCKMVGKHRRIPRTALQSYKEKMFQQAKNAADEITRMSQEMGLYDLEGPPPK